LAWGLTLEGCSIDRGSADGFLEGAAENVKRGRMTEGDEFTLVGAEALSPVSNNLTGGFCFELTHGAPTLLRAKFSRHLDLDNSWWAV
jgi:hypothetical protein